MPAIRCFDDDPDYGPPRMMTYEVVPLDTLLSGEGWRQRMHPLDRMRRDGNGELDVTGPRTKCSTLGCENKASERHRDCSTCRSKRTAKCVCGRRRSYGAVRCKVCALLDRRRAKGRTCGATV